MLGYCRSRRTVSLGQNIVGASSSMPSCSVRMIRITVAARFHDRSRSSTSGTGINGDDLLSPAQIVILAVQQSAAEGRRSVRLQRIASPSRPQAPTAPCRTRKKSLIAFAMAAEMGRAPSVIYGSQALANFDETAAGCYGLMRLRGFSTPNTAEGIVSDIPQVELVGRWPSELFAGATFQRIGSAKRSWLG